MLHRPRRSRHIRQLHDPQTDQRTCPGQPGGAADNAGILPNLIALHQSTGANIHYFDSNLFVNQIRANPTAYGFTAAGTATQRLRHRDLWICRCLQRPAVQRTKPVFTPDGLHWTYRYHEWLAAAIANQLLAPYTLAGQADLIDQTAQAFSNSTVRRLDTYRSRDMLSDLASADMPVKARPAAPGTYGNLSVYADGLYATGDTPDRAGGAGIGYNVGGATIGADYRSASQFPGWRSLPIPKPPPMKTRVGAA